MKIDPVNKCVSSIVLPNLVEPLWNTTEEEVKVVCICSACKVPLTINEPVISVSAAILNVSVE